jgi:methylenetetrahydrofolate dehydrogenase (NADP+)/methenyltetrahydrofolate cyclohydrolase
VSILIDGKKVAEHKRKSIKQRTEDFVAASGVVPGLAVILVGDDPASQVYVRNKIKACEAVGFKSFSHELSKDTTQQELDELIDSLNSDDSVHGILCQMPIPDHLDDRRVVDRISPEKDVDGFHPLNAGLLSQGRDTFVPCTPAGIMVLLAEYGIDPKGRSCVIVGRSNLVGKPLAQLMLQADATVTVAHSRTVNLAEVCRSADILVAAVGRGGLITADCIKEGAVVIDVGINRGADGKLRGDVDPAAAQKQSFAYTPVPGGVGPMTITMLLENTLKACRAIVSKR